MLTTTESDATAAPPLTALILDDDLSVRTVLTRLIESAGLAAENFATPDALLNRLSGDVAGCLVLDVRMPGLNGLDLYDSLVAQGKGLPVIFLSGYLDVALSVRAMKAGAIEVLQKPCDATELIAAVERAFETDRRRRVDLAGTRALRVKYDALTDREREVLEGVLRGLTNKAIAHELGTSEKTIKTHRGHLMHKIGGEGTADLVQFAERLGLHAAPSVR